MRVSSTSAGILALAAAVGVAAPVSADIIGTPHDDRIRGTAHHDWIEGRAGDDVIRGLGGAGLPVRRSGQQHLAGRFGAGLSSTGRVATTRFTSVVVATTASG
ncbi:hypothetical protein [Nocardioides sp. URHA0032]|uniref:hypothetical protein n=1 Tax=Nocardioides sp. URHA0032 TaxID=1380388 RepID=UPI0018CC5735